MEIAPECGSAQSFLNEDADLLKESKSYRIGKKSLAFKVWLLAVKSFVCS
jgi:hypothetical protein